ncbi:hypothetical protein Poli38472_012649 [Pythium oligandrum]|uniref:Uncharacterized protein n=1 Tax=Pythium oligandrum TaxID=41045 RepID=A0A8K1CEC2_PYTOL|nr:hypothetical protein Poli38472_012649 [Pythium oligandrum]|eukprot:TMW61458.1 hypothetical protein Poli38472_012649 [Pythium oligandrum]
MKIVPALLSTVTVLASTTQAISPSFDLLDHTNLLNFYHPAKTDLTPEQTALPAECKVDQVHVVARHMTRYPSTGSYKGVSALADKFATVLSWGNASELAPELEFIRNWTLKEAIADPSQVENITMRGLEEGVTFGKALQANYSQLFNDRQTTWSGSVERVQLSAKSYMEGYFGTDVKASNYSNLVISPSKDYSLGGNTLTPIDTCPNFIKESLADEPQATFRKTWLPESAARLEKLWPGFGFTDDNVLGIMDLCIYEMNFLGEQQRRFCNLFTDEEWQNYGYHKDIGYYYGSGYGNPLARTVGFPYIEAVAKLMAQKTTPYCQKVYVAFSHDTQLNVFATAYGLNYDATFPRDHILENRKFRASRSLTMGSRMITERITCNGQRYARVVINEAVVPFDDCQSGPGLSCPMEAFQQKIADIKTTSVVSKTGGQWLSAAGSGKLACVSRDDTGRAAAYALASADRVESATLTITGPEALTIKEITSNISEVLDKPIEVVHLSREELALRLVEVLSLPPPVGHIFASLDATTAAGVASTVTGDYELLTGVSPVSHREWSKASQHILASV